MPNKEPTKEWVDRFRKEFELGEERLDSSVTMGTKYTVADVKCFISQVIQSAVTAREAELIGSVKCLPCLSNDQTNDVIDLIKGVD